MGAWAPLWKLLIHKRISKLAFYDVISLYILYMYMYSKIISVLLGIHHFASFKPICYLFVREHYQLTVTTPSPTKIKKISNIIAVGLCDLHEIYSRIYIIARDN